MATPAQFGPSATALRWFSRRLTLVLSCRGAQYLRCGTVGADRDALVSMPALVKRSGIADLPLHGRVFRRGLPSSRFMSANFVTIRLPRRDIHYLINAQFLGPVQIEAVRAAESSGDGSAVLKLSRNLAAEFREAFTHELAKVGFDENYELTAEGRILEDLVDLFYVS